MPITPQQARAELARRELARRGVPLESSSQGQEVDASKKPDLASTLYHGAIEGGAMTLGGAAGAILGSPAGPVGSGLAATGFAAAMYPPAKRASEAIDRLRGITPAPQESSATEFKQGLEMEAVGKALKPALGLLGKVLPGAKSGEAVSGTPASNLKRAYKQGFIKTYLKPKSRAETGKALGEAKSKLMQDFLTPEEQAAMLVNPRGEANVKISDTYSKYLKGEPISAQDALATREAIDTVYPPETARNMKRIPKFAEFRSKLNEVIGQESPEFQKASKESAASILRSQLLKPARVNTSNPDKYSKLSGMLAAGFGVGGIATGSALPAVSYLVGTSPLAMGLTSSIAGSASRGVDKVITNDVARRSLIAGFVDLIYKGNAR